MPELDSYVRSSGEISGAEWTASVYRNPDNGPSPVDQLEAVLLDGGAQVSYDRVYLAVQHAFRCVALPSN
jgi:phage baseplate assembly protein gpV